jgi:hypothetical protein
MRVAILAAGIWCTAVGVLSAADQVTYEDKDGVTYRVTTRTVKRPILETKIQAQERTIYRQKVTTELQTVNRSYPVQTTRYQWMPVWQKSWNPFSPPYLVYRQVAVTDWETRQETVQIPVTKTEMVPEKLVDQTPVTTQRFVEDTYTERVAVGAKPQTAVATAPKLTPRTAETGKSDDDRR